MSDEQVISPPTTEEPSGIAQYWPYIAAIIVCIILIVYFTFYYDSVEEDEDEGFLNKQPRTDKRWNIIAKINEIHTKQQAAVNNLRRYKNFDY